MFRRMISAALLNRETYEEVEADGSATLQAMAVVVMVAVATGIGTLDSGGADAASGVGVFIGGVIVGLAGWVFWAWITYFVGTRLFRTPDTDADWGQMARTLGFAQSPGVLKAFGFIPGIGPVIFGAAAIWQLAAMVTAIRQALDYSSTWRAVGVALVGFIPYVILQALVIGLAMALFK